MPLVSALSRYLRDLLDLPRGLRPLFAHRELIAMTVWRGFSARYRGSFGGLFWSFAQPLVMMIIYSVVFSRFLHVRFTTDASPVTFSVYLLCGLLPWNAFAEGLARSTTVIRENANLVKRTVFPLEILPLNLALVAGIHQVIGFGLLLPLAWAVTGRWPAAIWFVPVILLLQLLFAVGLNWIVASLAVYVPDVGQIVALGLTVWMFLTPVFYPEDVVPETLRWILRLNPMARIVTLYRNAFMTGLLPSLGGFLGAFGLCLLVFLAGRFWFVHTMKGFADVV